MATGRWETLLAADWEVELLALDPAGEQLAYTLNEGGASRLFVRDLVSGATREAALGAAPGVVGQWDQRLSWSPDGTRLAFSFSSAVRTVDVFVWDVAGDQLFPVTAVSHGGLPLADFAVPQLITYPTFDAREIPAWYFPPRVTATPNPVIVMVHGGPEGQSRPSFNFLAHYFHQAGYAVLLPNVRGSAGYGKAYSHLDDVEKRMDSVADLAHAAHWLAAQPEIDAGRIVVYGGSYGGFMVLAALTTYPDLWAAGIDIVGISNLATFLENTSHYRRAHREAEYGSLARDRAFLESIAPINHSDRITAPLLVIHGANDPRVPLSEAQQLVAALEARDHPVELLVFDDEGHGIARLHNKQVAYPAMVDFLARHL
jgi:dipeptidyl aminopeptidase/acylaminoacyl peptidase